MSKKMRSAFVLTLLLVAICAVIPSSAFAATLIRVPDDGPLESVVASTVPDTVIELTQNVEVNEMVLLQGVNDVTFEGNGFTVTASPTFTTGASGQVSLFKVESSDNITLSNINLVTTGANRHALDLWQANNVVLSNVVLNHESALTGAPLIVNSSDVIVRDNFTVITGPNSWYGINIDDRYTSASITFASSADVSYINNSGNDALPLVFLELNNGTAPENAVINPENAGLTLDSTGQFVHEHDRFFLRFDETSHWWECSLDGAVTGLEPHAFALLIVREPTATEPGESYQECILCEYSLGSIAIPSTGEEIGSANGDGEEETQTLTPASYYTDTNESERDSSPVPTGDDSSLWAATGIFLVSGLMLLYLGRRLRRAF